MLRAYLMENGKFKHLYTEYISRAANAGLFSLAISKFQGNFKLALNYIID